VREQANAPDEQQTDVPPRQKGECSLVTWRLLLLPALSYTYVLWHLRQTTLSSLVALAKLNHVLTWHTTTVSDEADARLRARVHALVVRTGFLAAAESPRSL